jgi:hypothetical protein
MFTKEQIIESTHYAEGFTFIDGEMTGHDTLVYKEYYKCTLLGLGMEEDMNYPLFLQNTIEGLEDEHLIIIKPEQNSSGWRYHIVEQNNRYQQTYSGFFYKSRLEAKEKGILCVFDKLSRIKEIK